MEQFKSINKDPAYVREIQREFGVAVDGIFGRQSYAAAKAYYGMPIMIHMGQIIPIDSPVDIDLSQSLYELDDGTRNWYARRKKPSTVCVHWGGLNTRHCYNVFNLARGRHVSSHFLVGRNHKTKEFEILQCLDTGLAAYHAGRFNGASIGVDICMHPEKKYWEKTQKWYPDAYLEAYENEDPRITGRDIVMIGDEFADLCSSFLESLIYAANLQDQPICKTNEVMSVTEARKYSVVGHHNLSKRKWDVIPWAEKVYHNIEL